MRGTFGLDQFIKLFLNKDNEDNRNKNKSKFKKPPKNKKTILLAYGLAASWISTTPNIGNIARGTKAVTATGTASVAHHVPMSKKIAAVLCASTDSPSGLGRISTIIANVSPSRKPLLLNAKFITR